MENRVKLYGTKEGKLFIKPKELFALPKVKALLEKLFNRKNGK